MLYSHMVAWLYGYVAVWLYDYVKFVQIPRRTPTDVVVPYSRDEVPQPT